MGPQPRRRGSHKLVVNLYDFQVRKWHLAQQYKKGFLCDHARDGQKFELCQIKSILNQFVEYVCMRRLTIHHSLGKEWMEGWGNI